MTRKGAIFATCAALAIIALWLCSQTVRPNRLLALYGGRENAKTVSSPDRVEVYETVGFHWKMTNSAAPRPRNYSKAAGNGKVLPKNVVQRVGELLSNPQSYREILGPAKPASDIPEVILKFTRRNRTLELNLFLESAYVEVMSDGLFQSQVDIGPIRDGLASALAPFLSMQPRLDTL